MKLKKIKENIVFSNKYLTLYNDLVGTNGNITFNHLRIKEGDIKNKYAGVVIICKYFNKYLIIKNFRYGINKSIWEFPRGSKNENENCKENGIREIKEELNIDINDIKKIKKLGYIYSNTTINQNKIGIVYIKLKNEIDLNKIIVEKKEFINKYKFVEKKELYNKLIDSFSISSLFFYKKEKKKTKIKKKKIKEILRNTNIIIKNKKTLKKAKNKISKIKYKKIKNILKN